jgi:hypothetical protein
MMHTATSFGPGDFVPSKPSLHRQIQGAAGQNNEARIFLTLEVYSCHIRTRNGERCCKTDINKEYATPLRVAEHIIRRRTERLATILVSTPQLHPANNNTAFALIPMCSVLSSRRRLGVKP